MGTPEVVWLIILTMANGLFVAIRIIERKNGKSRYNPHPPGETKICRENRDMIIAATTEIEGIKDNIVAIFKKLDK